MPSLFNMRMYFNLTFLNEIDHLLREDIVELLKQDKFWIRKQNLERAATKKKVSRQAMQTRGRVCYVV